MLQATGASFEDFTALVTAEPRTARGEPIPLIGLTQAGGGGFPHRLDGAHRVGEPVASITPKP